MHSGGEAGPRNELISLGEEQATNELRMNVSNLNQTILFLIKSVHRVLIITTLLMPHVHAFYPTVDISSFNPHIKKNRRCSEILRNVLNVWPRTNGQHYSSTGHVGLGGGIEYALHPLFCS